MSKREKIIVALMILVVLYGAYDFFFVTMEKKPGSRGIVSATQTLDQVVNNIRQSFIVGPEGRIANYKIEQAEEEWPRDPFLSRQVSLQPREATSSNAAKKTPVYRFSYTGYVEMGAQKIAIINGREYAVGESLDEGNMFVDSILPDKVVLVRKDSKNKKVGQITVPIEEGFFFP